MVTPRRIELHSHTLYSDGQLLPSELARRAAMCDHAAIAMTDHADASNLGELVERLHRFVVQQPADWPLQVLVGVELTHVAPTSIARLARQARRLGAEWVVVHGETIVEPVAAGTNRAAIECPEVDLLAHPGFVTLEEARLAAERGMVIEITARKGHCLTNGHVALVCREAGALMVVDTDTHTHDNLITLDEARQVALGAGLTPAEADAAVITTPQAIVQRILMRRHTLSA
ncbi:MAG: histidinol phosphate phosphatase domain-containing protein [Anaerolineae bacterium]|jgi:putative hydrolase